ncbi:methyltransferase domain-containing protein [Streptomyces sp. NBC_01506]|uniref:methyltransferase domain-containing protein n=1 Tax=Streptomyces sp. NBC_01506 TaxID=2903887 RepID=UPI0038690DA8
MAVLVVQHVPGEGPYAVAVALEAAGLAVRRCRVWAGDVVPDGPEGLDGVAALVVMGGPMSAYSDAGFPTRTVELALLRHALAAEVPVLGICLGARLLAVAAGGDAYAGTGKQVGWGRVGLTAEAAGDPLFAGLPASLGVLHWHDDTMSLPAGAVVLASCERYPVQAFRAGSSAWGLQFHLEADEEAVGAFVEAFPYDAASAPGGGGPGIREAAPARLAELAPYRDQLFGRFAELAAARAGRTAVRTFFTPRAGEWEARFARDQPRYAAAVARLGLRPGQVAADVGCGSGRALPALREAVGARGAVFGVDLTAAMLRSAARERRGDSALASLLLADACQLPFADGALDGVFTAGLLNHLPDPKRAVREWARVGSPGAALALFHPSGRTERAARHGRPLSPDDVLAADNLRPLLEASGWRVTCYEDAETYFLTLAVRER